MKTIVNSILRRYVQGRYFFLERAIRDPFKAQEDVFLKLLAAGRKTEYGKKYSFDKIQNGEDFRKIVPVGDYPSHQPYIDRMMRGEANVLWPGKIHWYSKSSGTTAAKSKFIPVSAENLKSCHIKGSWYVTSILYNHKPDARVFANKNLIICGSIDQFEAYPITRYGDISAVMVAHMPPVGRWFYTPDRETALIKDWEEKINAMLPVVSQENVGCIGGVPTWNIVLFKKILEYTGKDNMLEVWPEMQAYLHGGVGFDPYREQFYDFFPSDEIVYLEIYNASEGFFGVQYDPQVRDMLLLVDNNVYYEFIPMSEWEKDNPQTLSLEEVETGVNYAIVVSTNAGLWRYTPGDTIIFTSTRPYRFVISGRTKQFINAFGEELIISNTDKAISLAAEESNAIVSEYTAAPVFLNVENKGCHEWVIEFHKNPKDLTLFKKALDRNLQEINSDYEAKRFKSMALTEPRIRIAPNGSFVAWMKHRGKFGNQNKVPRLSNDRKYIDDLLDFLG